MKNSMTFSISELTDNEHFEELSTDIPEKLEE